MASKWKEVRNDLEKSIELKRFVEHITLAIREQLDSSNATGESLSKLIEEKIQETLTGGEVVYTALQDKVAHEVKSHFLDGKTSKKDAILQTAADMLVENPSLRSMLTVFVNTPLHVPLRKALWSIILKDQTSREQFLMINEGMERKKSLFDPELLSRCASILEGKCLAEFSKHKQLSYEYCAILSFWKDKSKAELTTATCLLCLPFLNLFKDELRQSSKEVNWPIVAAVAEMFTSYMRILPLNMRNVRQSSQSLRALEALCKEVEGDLDPILVNHLREIFVSRSGKNTKEAFHYHLSILLHEFLQRMFIGILSIDVVSYMLDQCFMILEVPNCSFMHYLVASWLCLLEKKLINCQTVEKVSETLAKYSLSLTVADFQGVIKEKYLANIMSKVDVVKHDHSTKKQVGRKVTSRSINSRTSFNDSEISERGRSALETPVSQQDKRQKEKNEIEAEKLKYDTDIAKLQAELELLKKAVHGRVSIIKRAESSIVTEPPELPASLPPLNNTNEVELDPYNITESDVANMWLGIMRRFTAAKYLICHGTEEEKKQLQNI